ncbi:predicted protein [Sclerotinia sclerotiorum 1980 UF-70]|uniref:Uncharacterized protein n=1 Tax=Sclerotinia sclerotiorum (strain ATCC 18683 / 1980 / Ss-1) TaxID=665079 RepID=A7EIY7_SCLS1|nr:predicted protein [Sclerotinia sclerotiorum 1980 UF-70]EDO02803.1 predicted protein [Sclerotinia sclerotiorum 1980 UF-70]
MTIWKVSYIGSIYCFHHDLYQNSYRTISWLRVLARIKPIIGYSMLLPSKNHASRLTTLKKKENLNSSRNSHVHFFMTPSFLSWLQIHTDQAVNSMYQDNNGVPPLGACERSSVPPPMPTFRIRSSSINRELEMSENSAGQESYQEQDMLSNRHESISYGSARDIQIKNVETIAYS